MLGKDLMELRNCRPKNALAEQLFAKLTELGHDIYPGYHGTDSFCVGVKVNGTVEAVLLGMNLGSGWGDIRFDAWRGASWKLVVFKDALVQLT